MQIFHEKTGLKIRPSKMNYKIISTHKQKIWNSGILYVFYDKFWWRTWSQMWRFKRKKNFYYIQKYYLCILFITIKGSETKCFSSFDTKNCVLFWKIFFCSFFTLQKRIQNWSFQLLFKKFAFIFEKFPFLGIPTALVQFVSNCS